VDPKVAFVTIKSIGDYSLTQLAAMKLVHEAQDTCDSMIALCDWARGLGDAGDEAADVIEEESPSSRIVGFDWDMTYAHLAPLRGQHWFNDNILAAFGHRLRIDYPSVQTFVAPSLQLKSRSGLDTAFVQRVSESLCRRILVVVNISGSHWTIVSVDRDELKISIYDSMDGAKRKAVLRVCATQLQNVFASDGDFVVQEINAPLQTDSDNCGLYVCVFMSRCVEGPLQRSAFLAKNLPLLRLDLLRYILGLNVEQPADA
jgi:Ulp1 family protease